MLSGVCGAGYGVPWYWPPGPAGGDRIVLMTKVKANSVRAVCNFHKQCRCWVTFRPEDIGLDAQRKVVCGDLFRWVLAGERSSMHSAATRCPDGDVEGKVRHAGSELRGACARA